MNDISSSIDIFSNFNILDDMISFIQKKTINETNDHIQNIFSKKTKPGTIQRQGEKNEILQSFKEVFQVIQIQYSSLFNLEKVLKKKYQKSYHLCQEFWTVMSKSLNEKIQISIQQLKNIDDFPSIDGLFSDFVEKVKNYQSNIVEWKNQILEPFEKNYIQNMFNKWVEKINIIMKQIQSPLNFINDDQIDGIHSQDLRILSTSILNELHLVRNEERLLKIVAQNCQKGILFFSNSIEKVIITNSEINRIYDIPSRYQKFNSNIYQGILKFHYLMVNGIEPYHTIRSILMPSLNILENLSKSILFPFFKALSSHLEKILIKIHRNDYSIKQEQTLSPYILEFEQIIEAIQKNHFILYDQNSIIFINSSKQLVQNLIKFYMKQVSMIREMSEPGKLLLVREMSQIEVALSSSIYPLDNLKDLSFQYKSVRSLLFIEPSKIDNLTKTIDLILILHHLLGRIPKNDIKFPNQILNISIEKYSDWLNDNPTKEILKVLDECYKSLEESNPIYQCYLQIKQLI